MSMEQRNVPKLRFPGFKDEWEQCKLGDMMNVTSVKRIHQSDWTKAGVRFFRARDIVAASKNEEPSDYLYISKEKYDEYSAISGKVAKDDLLVTGVGTIGVPYLIRDSNPLYFKDGNIIWFQNKGIINGEFFYYSFGGKYIQSFIKDSAGIGTVGTYTIDSGKKTPIMLPLYDEQKRIGVFFSRFDDLITLQQRKLDQIKEYKKGMLQKMFPTEGASVPEVRFPGFKDEWEQRKLGDIVGVYDGTHQTPNYQDHGVMFVSVEDIQTLTSEKYISKEDFAKNFSIAPEPGDILMTRIGDIGTANIVKSDEPLAYYVSLALLKNTHMNAEYLKANISSPAFQNELWIRTLHTAYPKKINKDEIGKCLIRIAPSLEEQKKIGCFFSGLDTFITLHQRKLEAMKEYKKGLLQQMFV